MDRKHDRSYHKCIWYFKLYAITVLDTFLYKKIDKYADFLQNATYFQQ